MSQVRRYAAAGLDEAARRSRRRRMAVGALDETGQEKQGTGTAGRETAVHGLRRAGSRTGSTRCTCPTCGRRPGHALIGARQWIPAEDIADPVKSLVTGLPLDLRFRTKGQLAIDVLDGRLRRRAVVRLRLRRRGLRQLHRTAGVPGGPRAGLRAARRVVLHAHARRRDQDDLRGRGEEAAEGQAGLGGPLRRQGVQGRALVRLGLDRHRLPAAQPAGPPPPEDRRAGLSLLLRARRAGCVQGPADQGSGPALAGGGRASSSGRAASASTSARPGSTPRSCGTSCWSWPPSRSAPSPPPSCGTAPTPRPRRPPGRTTSRPPTPG